MRTLLLLPVLLFILVLRVSHGAEPAVWQMQVLVPDKDSSSSHGFVDLNGNVLINVDTQVLLALGGTDLDNVTHVAFTPQRAERGESDVFHGETARFAVSSYANGTIFTNVTLNIDWVEKPLFLVLFIAGQKLPVYQGLQLTVGDLTRLFLPIWIQLPIVVLLLFLSSLFSGESGSILQNSVSLKVISAFVFSIFSSLCFLGQLPAVSTEVIDFFPKIFLIQISKVS